MTGEMFHGGDLGVALLGIDLGPEESAEYSVPLIRFTFGAFSGGFQYQAPPGFFPIS